MIDYQLLQALEAIVSEGGFEKAASKLFITQSAVSRRIRNLESQLGEPVLIRTQPPKPTVKGKQLLNHLQQVLQLELELGVDAFGTHTAHNMPLTIRLATNADSLATWLPEALGLACDKPEQALRFDLVVEDQSVILNRMKSGEVMACISSEPKPVNGGKASFLGYLRYRAVASPDFVTRYKVTSLKDLEKCPCLAFDEHDKLQHQFLLDSANIEPLYFHLCPSPEGFRQTIIHGLGFGLLPELQFGDAIATESLVFLDEDYALDLPLYWHYWQTEGPQLKALRKHAISVASKRLKK